MKHRPMFDVTGKCTLILQLWSPMALKGLLHYLNISGNIPISLLNIVNWTDMNSNNCITVIGQWHVQIAQQCLQCIADSSYIVLYKYCLDQWKLSTGYCGFGRMHWTGASFLNWRGAQSEFSRENFSVLGEIWCGKSATAFISITCQSHEWVSLEV